MRKLLHFGLKPKKLDPSLDNMNTNNSSAGTSSSTNVNTSGTAGHEVHSRPMLRLKRRVTFDAMLLLTQRSRDNSHASCTSSVRNNTESSTRASAKTLDKDKKRRSFAGGEIITNVKHEFSSIHRRISHSTGADSNTTAHSTNSSCRSHSFHQRGNDGYVSPKKITRSDIVEGVYNESYFKHPRYRSALRRRSTYHGSTNKHDNAANFNNSIPSDRRISEDDNDGNNLSPYHGPNNLRLVSSNFLELQRMRSNHSSRTQITTATEGFSNVELVVDTDINVGLPMTQRVF